MYCVYMKSKPNYGNIYCGHKVIDLFVSYLCQRLEEIGASASKEHSLEKSMEKMKNEWTNLCFSFTAYRDTV